MLSINSLKPGDIIMVDDDGVKREGVIVNIDHVDHLAMVDNGIQEFWYEQQEMFPLPIDEAQLLKLGFEKQELNGEIKYLKGAFRLLTHKKGDFSNVEMWYREDRRHFNMHLGVHELQNLHQQMTKVPLEMD